MTAERDHPADLSPEQLLRECEVERTRRSGPGGQHRNKVETAVVLTHVPTNMRAEASERRSQQENLQVALSRLRVTLALAVRRPVPAPPEGIPSSLWQSRCPRGRIAVNPQHADFPSLLAEALDVLAAADFDVAPAADVLRCTPSQLIKFLKLDPRALAEVNHIRQARGLHRLH